MMPSSTYIQFIALMFWLQVTSGQIDETKCGVSSCCFRFPTGCSGTSCDILIAFQYNSTGVLDVEVGTRKSWVAFGLNNVRNQMDGTAGEICMRTTPSPRLIGFRNSGTSPDFTVPINGVNITSTVVQNNFLICRYSRPLTPPSGSYMLDINTNRYITAAFGDSVSAGSNPDYHGPSQSSTSSSPSQIDLKRPCSIGGTTTPPVISIDEAKCGVSSCCFRYPGGCSGATCDVLIAFQYNSTGVLDVEVGTRKRWVAFGLNNVGKKMDGTAGEICMRSTPSPRLIGFRNSGTRPDFTVPINGLNITSTVVQNNFLICRYSRPLTPPSGSYMLDINTNRYITAAFGDSVSAGSNPDYHGPSQSSTSSSPSQIDLKRPCSIGGTKTSPVISIDEAKCGVSSCCFRYPGGCSGATCDVLIVFQYNSTGVLDVEVGTRKSWVAFGLNNVGKKMDGTAGEICMRTTPSPRLIGFRNSGTRPDFTVPINGLSIKSTEVQNNFLVCRYSRPLTPPSGSYMLDINTNRYITAAFGDSVSGSNPGYHGPSQSSTSSSPSKIDFKKPCSISGTKASATNVIVHGSLMVIAWICFASSGIFIARFTRPLGDDQSCLGKRIWFQSHRICMVTALLLTIAGIIVIFVHKKGWSEGAGAHPVLGLVVSFLAVVQPIMAAFRPHPDEESRWLFNWAHRIVGVSAVIVSAATIMLGLDLFKANNVATIIWIVACVVLALVLEIGIQVIGKSSSSAEFNSAKNTVGVQVLETDTSTTFRTVMTGFAMVSFFALGFATVGIIAAKA